MMHALVTGSSNSSRQLAGSVQNCVRVVFFTRKRSVMMMMGAFVTDSSDMLALYRSVFVCAS